MWKKYVGRFILIMSVIAVILPCLIGCSSSGNYIEGQVETFMEMGGISERGIEMTMHNFLISKNIAYELVFLQDFILKCMEMQKGEKGIAIPVGNKSIVLHSGAVYRARGKITDTDRSFGHRPIKILKVNYFEFLKPGKGESGVTVGN